MKNIIFLALSSFSCTHTTNTIDSHEVSGSTTFLNQMETEDKYNELIVAEKKQCEAMGYKHSDLSELIRSAKNKAGKIYYIYSPEIVKEDRGPDFIPWEEEDQLEFTVTVKSRCF